MVVSPGWYMENFLDKDVASLFGGLPYFPDEDGYLTLNWPHWGGNDQVPLAAIGADFGDEVAHAGAGRQRNALDLGDSLAL